MTALLRTPRQLCVPSCLRDHARLALSRGWTISIAGSGHLRWRSPDGKTTVYTPRTPGCERSIANITAKLKRAGLDYRAARATPPQKPPGTTATTPGPAPAAKNRQAR